LPADTTDYAAAAADDDDDEMMGLAGTASRSQLTCGEFGKDDMRQTGDRTCRHPRLNATPWMAE